MADGAHVRDISGHGGAVVALAFLPNGSQIISGGDKTVRFWNAADGAEVRSIDTGANVTTLALSRDGQSVAVGGADNKVRLYKTADGAAIKTIDAQGAAITGVTFSADNKRLLTSGADKQARLWDIATGVELQRFTQPAAVSGVALTNDAKYAAIATEDGHVRQLATPAVATIAGHSGAVTSLAFNSNGTQLVTGGADKTVRLWNIGNVADIKQERAFEGSAAAVNDVDVSANNQLVAAARRRQTHPAVEPGRCQVGRRACHARRGVRRGLCSQQHPAGGCLRRQPGADV